MAWIYIQVPYAYVFAYVYPKTHASELYLEPARA